MHLINGQKLAAENFVYLIEFATDTHLDKEKQLVLSLIPFVNIQSLYTTPSFAA